MLIMPCLEKFEENDAKKRARLLASLSRSFPSSVLSKALRISRDENVDPLGFSCFSNVALETFYSKEADDLTSLAWLQDANLLKNIIQDNKLASPQPNFDPLDPLDLLNAPCDTASFRKLKPPYSFSCLIFMAIEASPTKCLPVRGIYDWIAQTFPYFQSAPRGWRNSVRHNLSLNKRFKRIDRSYHLNLGKGSSWCIDPAHRSNLLQTLVRTPYHPFHQCQMMSSITEAIHRTNTACSSNETIDQEKFSTSAVDLRTNLSKGGTNGGYSAKHQSAFADVGRTKERIIEDMRLCSYLSCTAYPNDDHIYSIPGPKVEEARAQVDNNTSVEETLHLRLESEKETDNVKSESRVNLTNGSKKSSISRPKNHTTEISTTEIDTAEIASRCQIKTVVTQESKEALYVDSPENEEMKTLYFTSLALLELSAGEPANSRGNKIQERNLESKYDSREASQILNQPCVRSSRRRAKLPAAIHTNTPSHNDELPTTSGKVGKRKRKQPVPANGSRWQKKTRLRSDDKNLQILPNKTSSKKKMLRIKKRDKSARR